MANGDGVSIVTSSFATLGVTQVEPLVSWAASGFKGPMPQPVVSLAAVAVVACIHLAQKAVSKWLGEPDADPAPISVAAPSGGSVVSPGTVKSLAIGALVGLAALAGVSACSSDQSGKVANGWTTQAAANVEYSAATAVVLQLKSLEAQMPAQKALIKASAQGFSTGLQTQINDLLQGSSASVQSKDAALNAVLAVMPNLSGVIQAAQQAVGGVNSVNALSNVIEFLSNEAVYVGPAVLKANQGTTSTADVSAAQQAFQAAVASL